MATLKANGGLVVFTATKRRVERFQLDLVHRIMSNGVALRRRQYEGGGFKKVRTVRQSRGMTFAAIANDYTERGFTVQWKEPALIHAEPTAVRRRRQVEFPPFYAGVGA